MALLYITEYRGVMSDVRDARVAVAEEPPIADQTPVDFSEGEAKSAVLNGKTRVVRIHTDAACHILIGEDPTASVNNQRLSADSERWCALPERSNYKISVIGES